MTLLASCDKVEASLPADQENQAILNVDGVDSNTLKEIYDALVTSGNTNSEKILNNILYRYSESLFGPFLDKTVDGETEKGMKTVVGESLGGSTTDIDAFLSAHGALQVKNEDGTIDFERSRIRVKNICFDILYRVYQTFLGYITNSSYQYRSQFNERLFYEAQQKEYYSLGAEYNDVYNQVTGDLIIDENEPGTGADLKNDVIDHYFKNIWGTYGEYISLAVLPDIYRNELTCEYMYTQNDAQINLTAARNVEYISLASNAQYSDAVSKLMQQYCRLVINEGKMEQYPFSFLSSLYKGADDTYNDPAGTSDDAKMAKQIYDAAGWTSRTITVGSQTINYYRESSFGTICEKYATLLGNTSRDDSNWSSNYNDFTSNGAYGKETGFYIKRQSLLAEGHVTEGWYTPGGLSALPSSLNSRIFKAGVANEVDDAEMIKNDEVGNFGRYIKGSYFLTPASYADSDKYPYLVKDGSNFFLVHVKEATRASKFTSSTSETEFRYDTRAALEGERISRKVAYSLSSIDTWKSDAKKYYVGQMAVMYHDDYVYEYFKSQFPDLFD